MLPGPGTAVVRAAAVVPAVLLVLFTGLLWLLGLLCGSERRKYVMNLSQQAMGAVGLLLHDPAITSPRPQRRSSASSGLAGLPSLAQADRYVEGVHAESRVCAEGDVDAGPATSPSVLRAPCPSSPTNRVRAGDFGNGQTAGTRGGVPPRSETVPKSWSCPTASGPNRGDKPLPIRTGRSGAGCRTGRRVRFGHRTPDARRTA
jgi:hypothetical protein